MNMMFNSLENFPNSENKRPVVEETDLFEEPEFISEKPISPEAERKEIEELLTFVNTPEKIRGQIDATEGKFEKLTQEISNGTFNNAGDLKLMKKALIQYKTILDKVGHAPHAETYKTITDRLEKIREVLKSAGLENI